MSRRKNTDRRRDNTEALGQKRPANVPKKSSETGASSRRISPKVKIAVLLALAGIGLGVGGYLNSSGKNNKEKPRDLSVETSPHVASSGNSDSDGPLGNPLEREQITAQLIERIEKSFPRWEEKLIPLIDSIADEELRMELKAPFEIVKINRNNPDKNYAEFERRIADADIATLGQPYYFEYDANNVPSDPNFVAGYSPAEARMFLSPSFNPDNPIDFLVLFHELKHVATDSNMRLGLKSDRDLEAYMNFYNTQGVKRIIINDEVGAYAFELEILNLLVDGALREDAKHTTSLTPEAILKKLNSSPENIEIANMLLDLSRKYFPHGLTSGVPSKEFFDLITYMYRSRGYELYIKTSTGGLKRY